MIVRSTLKDYCNDCKKCNIQVRTWGNSTEVYCEHDELCNYLYKHIKENIEDKGE